jgi:hypothetical protein
MILLVFLNKKGLKRITVNLLPLSKIASMSLFFSVFKQKYASYQRLIPIILATCETEIMRIRVLGQHKQIVHKTPSAK